MATAMQEIRDFGVRVNIANSAPQLMEEELRFDQFRLLRGSRLLLENERPVRLGGRALDLLMALLSRAGEVVSKDELISYAWPDTIVEETNLRFHISSLRKSLGDGNRGSRFIANVSGRGYCFVGKVERLSYTARPAPVPVGANRHNLPVGLTRVFGRGDLIDSIVRQLTERRFISIVGPGGMGKSTVALAACEQVLASYPDGVWFVDLAPVSSPALVPRTLAAILGVQINDAEPTRALAACLRDSQMLILMDNCEHVVEATALLAEELLKTGKGISILTTSREPLQAKGERIQRVPPLLIPQERDVITADEAMKFSAIQLFVDRAIGNVDSFDLTDRDVPTVVEICRKLDGMPFALELAAAHVGVFGTNGLLLQLSDRFPMLNQSRRAASARHQTLRTLLDWSFNLLSDSEREQLQRLSVFPTAFTLAAAAAIQGEEMGRTTEGIVALASKSLIVIITDADEVRYKLLATTRAYALDHLSDSGQAEETRHRHAAYVTGLLARAEADWPSMSHQEWIAAYAPSIDDIRTALEWATFSVDGLSPYRKLVGVGAVALVNDLSLHQEFARRCDLALERYLDGKAEDLALEFDLCAALAGFRTALFGASQESESLYARTMEIANHLDSIEFRERATTGLLIYKRTESDHPVALKHAEALTRLAFETSDRTSALNADRLRAQCLFKVGELRESKRLIDRVLRSPSKEARMVYPYHMDKEVAMKTILAMLLWVEGYPEQAMRVVDQIVAPSEGVSAFEQSMALAHAGCPVALWTGNTEVAGAFIGRLRHLAARHNFKLLMSLVEGYASALAHLETAAEANQPGMLNVDMPAPRADVMATMGLPFLTRSALEGLAVGRANWCAAEVLRVQGELAMSRNTGQDDLLAESLYDRSAQLARGQGALSWELRTAISMARLKQRQGVPREGRAQLELVYGKFTEGFQSSDLRRANTILIELRG